MKFGRNTGAESLRHVMSGQQDNPLAATIKSNGIILEITNDIFELAKLICAKQKRHHKLMSFLIICVRNVLFGIDH